MKTLEQQSILAAEILGWTGCYNNERYATGIDAHGIERDLPDFHTDANALLQLIEWMEERGWTWTANRETNETLFVFRHPESRQIHHMIAATFPLAVLGAFLKANGKEIE